MTMFYECGYPLRLAYMVFLLITILTLLFLLRILTKWKCEKMRIALCGLGLVACFVLYTILLDDHIILLETIHWQRLSTPIPIAVLWIFTIVMLSVTGASIVKTYRQHKNTVTEENIKEAIDETPLAICCFKENGIPMLCNHRMQEISEMMCGRIFMSYFELKELLAEREEWRDPGDIFRFPDGVVCRYAEEEIVTADGEHHIVSYFFDISELFQKRTELEAQNEELRKTSVELQSLKENVQLLAKEEEILSIKSRWHDVMGEGLTAIRSAIHSNQQQEATGMALKKKWSDAVTTTQRDIDDSDQRQDTIDNLLRDAAGLRIQLLIEGEMPKDKETQQVFILAMRNCLLNAAQHAKATELYAEISQTEKEIILSMTNNGIEPKSDIVPHGGLINVKNYAERMGGRTEIQSMPRFELKVIVPRKE